MTASTPDVLIVGGGIGGLALALSCHQAGISCRVFESAPEVLPLGVGINLLPHAMRELSELGLAAALDRENEALNRGVATADFREAFTARMEKRPPVFRGR